LNEWPSGKVVEMQLVKAEPLGKALLGRPMQTYRNIWEIDLGLIDPGLFSILGVTTKRFHRNVTRLRL
jgi:hypothetical protein